MPFTPEMLTQKYALILQSFRDLGYRTPLTLALRLEQSRRHPYHPLPLTLTSANSSWAPQITVYLEYREAFVVWSKKESAAPETFKLESLNELLQMRQEAKPLLVTRTDSYLPRPTIKIYW